jgi:hypothetical protein
VPEVTFGRGDCGLQRTRDREQNVTQSSRRQFYAHDRFSSVHNAR